MEESTMDPFSNSRSMYVTGSIVMYDEYGSSGIIQSRGGGKFIRFHRYRVYINGQKFFSQRLLWQSLPNGSFLRVLINHVDKPYFIGKYELYYNALVAWTGHLPSISPYILQNPSFLNEPTATDIDEGTEYQINCLSNEIIEMSGNVYWACNSHGLVVVKSKREMQFVFIVFTPNVLYVHGQPVPIEESFQLIASQLSQCNLFTKPIEPRRVFGVTADYEAVLMWRGRKPQFKLVYNTKPKGAAFNLGDPCTNRNIKAHPSKPGPHGNNSSMPQPYPSKPGPQSHPSKPGPQSHPSKQGIHGNNSNMPQPLLGNIPKKAHGPNSENAKNNDRGFNTEICTIDSDNFFEDKILCRAIESINITSGSDTIASNNLLGNIISPNNFMDSVSNISESIDRLDCPIDGRLPMVYGSYFTGPVIAVDEDIAVYGSYEKASYFEKQDFYIHGEKINIKEPLYNVLRKNKNNETLMLHSFVCEIKNITPILGWPVQWKAKYVWVGTAPLVIKEALKHLKRIPLSIRKLDKETHSEISKYPDGEINGKSKISGSVHKTLSCEAADILSLINTNKSVNSSTGRLINEGEVRGYMLTADDNEGIMTSFHDIVVFGRRKLYINGKKFDKNGSIQDFFEGESVMVKCWIVTLEAPRIVQNTVVFSRAICAWTGKVPDDLNRLKEEYFATRKKEKRKSVGNTGGIGDNLVGFHYLVGRLIHLDTAHNQGILQCERDGKSINVAFNKDSIYKHGVKLPEKTILQNYTLILGSSRWSLLAKKVKPLHIGEIKANMFAVAVWHFQNQSQLFDEFNVKLSMWALKLENKNCDCQELKYQTHYDGVPMAGKIFTLDNKYIVIEAYNGPKEHLYIRIKKKNLWVDGCLCAFSTADEKRKCNLVCPSLFENDPIDIHGLNISIEAGVGWIGIKPSHITLSSSAQIDVMCDDDDDDDEEEEDEDIERQLLFNNNIENVNNCDDAEDRLVDVYDGSGDIYTCVLRKMKSKRRFNGKYITGRIFIVSPTYCIVQWISNEHSGSIFVVIDNSSLYIDKLPLSQRKVTSNILCERSCNLYVIPVENDAGQIKLDGVIISLQATVGWIGKKPLHLPGPGLQDNNSITLDNLAIGIKATNSSEYTFTTKQSEINSKVLKPTIGANSNNLTLSRHKSTMNIGATNHINKTTISSSTLDVGLNNSVLLPSYNNPPNVLSTRENVDTTIDYDCRTNKENEASISHNKGQLVGKISELHAKVGVLKKANGENIFFSSSQCYLFGVNLKDVELWHVLITGIDLNYTVIDQQVCSEAIDEVWIGPRKFVDANIVASHIYEWCTAQTVPNKARDILIESLHPVQ